MSLRDILLAGAGISGGGDEPEPTVIGQEYGGGYYAGKMKYDDGEYYLVVAPKSARASGLFYKTTETADTGVSSLYDGLANTDAINNVDHPAALHCKSLNIKGHADWYLPARDELELVYRNLKPGVQLNTVGSRPAVAGGGPQGENLNSVPVGAAYTTTDPAQTSALNFRTGAGEQELTANSGYWASTEAVGDGMKAMNHSFQGSGANATLKTNALILTCPVRRVKAPPPAPEIGDSMEGGYLAGTMRYTDGDYYLILAPKAAEVNMKFKTTATNDAGTSSLYDGLANTNAVNDATHPAAQYCRSYAGGGFNDWYLPARDELELCLRNFKPTTTDNFVGLRPGGTDGNSGTNLNSVPNGAGYTAQEPSQTTLTDFKLGGSQSLDHASIVRLTSTQHSISNVYMQYYDTLQQTASDKTGNRAVRPVRRVKIS